MWVDNSTGGSHHKSRCQIAKDNEHVSLRMKKLRKIIQRRYFDDEIESFRRFVKL